jgi:sulfate permease, SulP family
MTDPKKHSSRWAHIPGDLTGGLTAAIVALPIALAFGVASGLGAAAGVYGAICCGIFAAMFGGTATQVSGPTGPMTVVVAAMVSAHPGHPELIFAVIALAGILQIGLGFLRAGQLVEYIPYPVVSGFMSGIGMIIIILQLRPLVGLPARGEVLASITSLPEVFFKGDFNSALIGLLSLAAIYLSPAIQSRLLPAAQRHLPAALIALVVGTTVALVLNLKTPTISHIPSGFPLPKLPSFDLDQWHIVITHALSLATLGAIDSLLTSVVVDRLTKTAHDSNRELLGQGIGNVASGLIGGLPGAGATMRSVINIKSGASTRLSGVTHGLVLLCIVLGLSPFAEKVPLACLAAILISVGISIIDYRALKAVRKAPKEDVVVMLIVLLHTIFVDLIIAVIAGVAVTSLLFAKKMSDTPLMNVDPVSSYAEANPVVRSLPEDLRNEIYVYSFHGPLFFGEVKHLQRLVEDVPAAHFIILRFASVPFADQSGTYALHDALDVWRSAGVRVIFVKLNDTTKQTLTNLGVQIDQVFETIGDAVAYIAFGRHDEDETPYESEPPISADHDV